jgi:hypothetical protein
MLISFAIYEVTINIHHLHILIYASDVFVLLFSIAKYEYNACLLFKRPHFSGGT